MKSIWIDLDNTPHIPFFKPIIDELTHRGYQVTVTARNAFQVYDLADHYHLEYQRVGRHYGKSKVMKVVGSIIRALQLVATMMMKKPALAVSHGSRTQLIAARILGIPSIMIYDYEFTTRIAPFCPTYIMVPEVIPDSALPLGESVIYKYPGIKEDVYVPRFSPDSVIINELGVSSESLLVTIRPPATEAHYHRHESQELYEAVVNFLSDIPNTQLIILPRNKKQEDFVRETWPIFLEKRKIIVPDHAIDGLNLIWFSDLVISGGGTMNREAAALGVPVYSIFRSKIGAVDRYLAASGRLVLLEKPEDFTSKIVLSPRVKEACSGNKKSDSLLAVVEKIVEVFERPEVT